MVKPKNLKLLNGLRVFRRTSERISLGDINISQLFHLENLPK